MPPEPSPAGRRPGRPRRRAAPVQQTGAQPRPAMAQPPPPPELVASMPAVPAGQPCLLVCVVSNRAGNSTGGTSLLWLCRRYQALGEARQAGRALVEAGQATTSYVVSVHADGSRDVMIHATHPASVAKVLKHYEALWDVIDPP